MFTCALVALDLSPAEEPILACLPDLAGWGINKVILTHVIPVGYNQFAGFGHEDEYRSWLDNSAAPLRAAGLVVEVSIRNAGVVADELLTVARETAADLVVIGSRAQSKVRGLFLGSVARDLIRKTTLPTLLEWVEPSADRTAAHCKAVCHHTLSHVLLATDLSKHARGAEDTAALLATKAESTDLLTVLTPDAIDDTPALPDMVAAAHNAIRQRLGRGAPHGDNLIENGMAAETIVRVAHERQCTLIIVGKHGRGWLESKVIGSTAAKLCETARRPVLIVP
jgi:nucleotide-binding universal stress UspA family protein